MPNPRFDNTKLRNFGAIVQRGKGGGIRRGRQAKRRKEK
jgi:hypothetical protein